MLDTYPQTIDFDACSQACTAGEAACHLLTVMG